MLEDYYYISDRKIATYGPQVGRSFPEQLSAEVKADLGFLETKLSTLAPSQDRIARMILVRDYIRKHYDIGTTEFPGVWVEDTLEVKHIRPRGNADVFFLLGKNGAGEVCALLGSSEHIVGNRKSEEQFTRASYFPDFANLILGNISRFDRRDFTLDAFPPDLHTGFHENELCSIFDALLSQARSYPFKVKFLARQVFENKATTTPVCKAFTPLYVKIDEVRA